ncbi:AAA domain-containing protein [Pseudoalteromonas fenneropenaei]|uniref:AAA domain-containing protein n=1 Tax=Pseudoalteromonas fenneropenaei TaxID=1737459 RepID=A0ABV7CMQ3_9GAMM
MDEYQYLILTSYLGKWIDKTNEIKSLTPYRSGYNVEYKDGIYKYGHSKIKVLTKPEIVAVGDHDIFVYGKPLRTGTYTVLKFTDYFCVFIDGNKTHYPIAAVSFVKNIAQTQKTLEIVKYYAKLAHLKKDEKGSQHLHYYYSNKLRLISDDSIAARFIDSCSPCYITHNETLIFPFGINLSQRQALKNALNSQLSLIQGPPGTGKTQTILNLIANLIMQGKSVAVAAGNNSAVANVHEKLEKSNLGFLAAVLGSKKNVDAFFENLPTRPDMSEWHIPPAQQSSIKKILAELDTRITELLESKNLLAKEKSYLDKLTLEKRYFDKNFGSVPLELDRLSIFQRWQTPAILNFMADFEYHSQFDILTWKTKLKWLFKYRIYKFSELNDFEQDAFKRLISKFYQSKITETEQVIYLLEQKLDTEGFETLLKRQSELSMRLFKSFIANKYYGKIFKSTTPDNYNKQGHQDFIIQFPVTLSTTDSLISNKPNTALFDFLIVDEASQVNLLSGFLAMCCAKNMVVVGDIKQLPHIAEEELKIDIHCEFGQTSPYDYKRNSLLASLTKLFPSSPTTLLKEHYRCHPRIIEFCNQKYYGGELVVMTEGHSEPFKVIKTEKGNHAAPVLDSKGLINQREIDVIEQEVLPIELAHTSPENIGVITPYRAQADKCSAHFNQIGIDANTVHKFQGREKDAIIFTTTANKINRHIDQSELINVTVSRAKNRLTFVSSQNLIKEHGTNIGDLMRYIDYQSESQTIYESEVVSIFDCLYREYSEKLNTFMSKVKRNSEFLSQDLMSTLIDELLSSGNYSCLTYKKDYSLAFLFSRFDVFTNQEAQFIQHPSSHVDFIFYNTMDMLPVLAIEVDGYNYHDLNPLQLDRDAIKNSIFNKAKIPLYRFSTKGSTEREKLVELLSPWKVSTD